MLGASASFTVTLKEHEPVFPHASIAEHVTIVTPFGNVQRLGGAHDTGAFRTRRALSTWRSGVSRNVNHIYRLPPTTVAIRSEGSDRVSVNSSVPSESRTFMSTASTPDPLSR